MACEASAAYAQARAAGKDPEKAGEGAWESAWNFDKEDKDEEHRLVWGGVRSFDDFLEKPPRADESGDGWSAAETSRFGRYAERLWRGPLAHEVIEDTMSRSRIEQAPEFDVCGPLPSGVTVLEASAGTGKTYAIAALTARYVAEGVPLNELLLVTFTRSATGELRERIREQLGHCRTRAWPAAFSARPPGPSIPSSSSSRSGSREEVLERRDYLLNAVSDFDAATIATTHSFCQDVLTELGIAADIDPAYRVRR